MTHTESTGPSPAESQPSPGSIPTDSSFDNPWSVYKEIRTFEDQFNKLQSTYRTLASTWVLAMFAGIGFVMQHAEVWKQQEFLVAAGIALAGAVGLELLWVLDLLVYQRLLGAAFIEGVALESRYPWLPQIRRRMRRASGAQSASHLMAWFYAGGVALACCLSGGFALLAWRSPPGAAWPLVLTATIGVIAGVGALLFVASRRPLLDDDTGA